MNKFVALGIVSVGAVASATAARPVRNSFVNHKVTDTSSLVAHVRSDKDVADRYERHFGMTKPEVLAYLKGLHRAPLTKSGMYTIYSVPEGGRLKMHVGPLKKGEPMFVNRAGQPVLIVKCGNPVALGPSRVRRGNPVAVNEPSPEDMRELTEMPDTESFLVMPGPDELLVMEPEVPEEVFTEQQPLVPGLDGLAPVPPADPMVGTGLGAANSISPFFSAIPFFFPIIGSRLSSTSGNGGPRTDPVPEPMTMVALGAGAAAVLRRRKSR